MKEYMKELDILFSIQKSGSKMVIKKDLLFPFIKCDSMIISVPTLRLAVDALPSMRDGNELQIIK